MGHRFEGWFGSEEDFVTQRKKSMVQCPMCGDAHILKKLSAPRLNLLSTREVSHHQDIADQKADKSSPPVTSAAIPGPDLTAAWMQIAQSIVSNTDDVGTEFAEVVRKMHYGETEGRAIRGQTTRDEARSLMEEGIEIVPFALPDALKKPLQ